MCPPSDEKINSEKDSAEPPESFWMSARFRRIIKMSIILSFVIGTAGLTINLVLGPKIKRDSLCRSAVEGQPVNLKKLTEVARKFDRVPVIAIDSADGSDSRQMDPPNPDQPDPPSDLSGSFSVNFGTRSEPVICLIRFKEGIVSVIRASVDE